AGVASLQDRGQVHPVFDLLRRAAVNTWAAERRPAEPLTDAERDRLEAATAQRAVDLLREGPRCRLDRDSLHGIVATPSRCTWDRVLRSLAQRDYDDAIVRVLGRIKIGRGLDMPISCVLQILPHVQRLDIFFLIVRRANENPAPALRRWLECDPL